MDFGFRNYYMGFGILFSKIRLFFVLSEKIRYGMVYWRFFKGVRE